MSRSFHLYATHSLITKGVIAPIKYKHFSPTTFHPRHNSSSTNISQRSHGCDTQHLHLLKRQLVTARTRQQQNIVDSSLTSTPLASIKTLSQIHLLSIIPPDQDPILAESNQHCQYNKRVNIILTNQTSLAPIRMTFQNNTSSPPEPSETQLFAPQPDSPFFSKLPGELRNRIYRLVLIWERHIPIRVRELPEDHQETEEPFDGVTSHTSPRLSTHSLDIDDPLLQVCKQIRHEASEIYYLENTFEVTTSVFEHTRALEELGRALLPWAAKMTRLSVCHELDFFVPLDQMNSGNVYMRLEFTASRHNGALSILQRTPTPLPDNEDNKAGFTCLLPSYWSHHEYPDDPRYLMCICKIQRCATAQGDEDVVRFIAKTYASCMREVGLRNPSYTPHCWSCARYDVLQGWPTASLA